LDRSGSQGTRSVSLCPQVRHWKVRLRSLQVQPKRLSRPFAYCTAGTAADERGATRDLVVSWRNPLLQITALAGAGCCPAPDLGNIFRTAEAGRAVELIGPDKRRSYASGELPPRRKTCLQVGGPIVSEAVGPLPLRFLEPLRRTRVGARLPVRPRNAGRKPPGVGGPGVPKCAGAVSLFDHLIFESHAFGIVSLEPPLRGFGVGECPDVIGMADMIAGVDVKQTVFITSPSSACACPNASLCDPDWTRARRGGSTPA
jgi:hypothetical protein